MPASGNYNWVRNSNEKLSYLSISFSLIFGPEAEAKGFSVSKLSTGIVCGIYGREIRTGKGKGTTGGKFQVEDVIFPMTGPQPKLENINDDRWVVFIYFKLLLWPNLEDPSVSITLALTTPDDACYSDKWKVLNLKVDCFFVWIGVIWKQLWCPVTIRTCTFLGNWRRWRDEWPGARTELYPLWMFYCNYFLIGFQLEYWAIDFGRKLIKWRNPQQGEHEKGTVLDKRWRRRLVGCCK